MAEPSAPDAQTREHVLAVLGELVARGGDAPLLAPPVAPGADAFPEPWAPTRVGAELLLRRLAWHAGMTVTIDIDDRRAAAPPPTERRPATRVEVMTAAAARIELELGFI